MFWLLSFIPNFISFRFLLFISLFNERAEPSLALTSTGIKEEASLTIKSTSKLFLLFL